MEAVAPYLEAHGVRTVFLATDSEEVRVRVRVRIRVRVRVRVRVRARGQEVRRPGVRRCCPNPNPSGAARRARYRRRARPLLPLAAQREPHRPDDAPANRGARPVSPLHLPYISPTSPPYLPHISPISPLYLPYISPISTEVLDVRIKRRATDPRQVWRTHRDALLLTLTLTQ